VVGVAVPGGVRESEQGLDKLKLRFREEGGGGKVDRYFLQKTKIQNGFKKTIVVRILTKERGAYLINNSKPQGLCLKTDMQSLVKANSGGVGRFLGTGRGLEHK